MSKIIYEEEKIAKERNLDNYMAIDNLSFERKKMTKENNNYPKKEIIPVRKDMDEMEILNKILLEDSKEKEEILNIKEEKVEPIKESKDEKKELTLIKEEIIKGVKKEEDIKALLNKENFHEETKRKNLQDLSGNILGNEKDYCIKKETDSSQIIFCCNKNGIFDNLTALFVSTLGEIKVNTFAIFTNENGYYKIPMENLLLQNKSIEIDRKNKSDRIIANYLKENNLNKDSNILVSKEKLISLDAQELKKLWELAYKRECQKTSEDFDKLIEKIYKNQKSFNNNFYQSIENPVILLESQEDYHERKLAYRREQKNIIDIRNFNKNVIKSIGKSRNKENHSEILDIIFVRTLFTGKKAILENREVPENNDKQYWNFIFDKEKMILSYLRKINKHTSNLSYGLENLDPKYQMIMKNYGENSTMSAQREKVTALEKAREFIPKSKIIDVPGYLKTYYLLEENNELINKVEKEPLIAEAKEKTQNNLREKLKLKEEIELPEVKEERSDFLFDTSFAERKIIPRSSPFIRATMDKEVIDNERKEGKKQKVKKVTEKEMRKKEEYPVRRYKYVF